MANLKNLHVVSKLNISRHVSLSCPQTKTSLGSGSVRVQAMLISLTSNNLSYARAGTVLRFWDSFPVPRNVPAPYHDQEQYGIVPAWGYGRIVQSTTAIAEGSVIFGYMPTTSLSFDLELERVEPDGHWREVSEQRSKMMNIYNRYQVVSEPALVDVNSAEARKMAFTTLVQPVWGCGYLLNRYTFTPDPAVYPPIHPLGIGGPWTAADADISSAVLISLSAASKTGQSFAWQLLRNRDLSKGPLRLLQAASDPSACYNCSSEDSKLPNKSVRYDMLSDPSTLEWIASSNPTRLVMVDMGASARTLQLFLQALQSHPSPIAELPVTIIGVGSEAKVFSAAEMKANMETASKTGRIQYNTSAVRDRAMEAEGVASFWTEYLDTWKRFLDDRGTGDIEIVWGEGVQGPDGIEGGWESLCQGGVAGDKGLVYRL